MKTVYINDQELIEKYKYVISSDSNTIFAQVNSVENLIELLTLINYLSTITLISNKSTVIAIFPNELFDGYTIKSIISNPSYNHVIRPRIIDKKLFIFLNGCSKREDITSDIVFQKDGSNKTFERVENDKWIVHDIHENPKLNYVLRPRDFFNFYIANPELKLLNL